MIRNIGCIMHFLLLENAALITRLSGSHKCSSLVHSKLIFFFFLTVRRSERPPWAKISYRWDQGQIIKWAFQPSLSSWGKGGLPLEDKDLTPRALLLSPWSRTHTSAWFSCISWVSGLWKTGKAERSKTLLTIRLFLGMWKLFRVQWVSCKLSLAESSSCLKFPLGRSIFHCSSGKTQVLIRELIVQVHLLVCTIWRNYLWPKEFLAYFC